MNIPKNGKKAFRDGNTNCVKKTNLKIIQNTLPSQCFFSPEGINGEFSEMRD